MTQYKAHQEALSATLETILPNNQRDRFQRYLDYKEKTAPHFVNEHLGLTVTPPAKLMEWGANIEQALDKTHRRTDHLRERLFATLSDALYALGYTIPEWVAPRADSIAGRRPYIHNAFRLAREYRQTHLDGKDVITADGPFVNGLAKRLGIKASEIFETGQRVSAFEMAYWAVQEKQQQLSMQESPAQC